MWTNLSKVTQLHRQVTDPWFKPGLISEPETLCCTQQGCKRPGKIRQKYWLMQSRRQIRKTNGQRPVTSLPGKDRSYLLEETNLKMGKYFSLIPTGFADEDISTTREEIFRQRGWYQPGKQWVRASSVLQRKCVESLPRTETGYNGGDVPSISVNLQED